MNLAATRCLVLGYALAVQSNTFGATMEGPDQALRQILIEAINQADSFVDRYEAEVWLLDMSTRLAPRMPDAEKRMVFLRMVHREATRANLDPELVLSVIQAESNFDRFAISYAGARGFMQIMPFWLDEIGRPEDNLFHTRTNLRFGCTILRHYLDMENGDLQKALSRYNGSIGKIWYPKRVFEALNGRWIP